MPATTITGMNTVNLPSDSGWDPEQVLATITSAISRAGGAEPTSVTIPIGVLPVATPTTLGITTQPLVTVFTATDVWVKRNSTRIVSVFSVGAGGGGGGGGTYAPGSGSGGGGGGSGSYDYRIFDAALLASSIAVTVGAGGAGGTSVSTTGGSGGVSSFGTLIAGGGGGGGGPGSLSATSGGGAGPPPGRNFQGVVGTTTGAGAAVFGNGGGTGSGGASPGGGVNFAGGACGGAGSSATGVPGAAGVEVATSVTRGLRGVLDAVAEEGARTGGHGLWDSGSSDCCHSVRCRLSLTRLL